MNIIFTLVFGLFLPLVTHACVVLGDPWFLADVTINQNSLPQGVIVISTTTANIAGDSLEVTYAELVNKTDTPLIVIGDNTPGCSQDAPLLPLPPELSGTGVVPGPCAMVFKFQNGRTYGNATGASPTWIWDFYDQYGDYTFMAGNLVSLGVSNDSCAGGRGQCGGTEDRPDNVAVPAPHPFTLHALYGKKPIVISGAITYRLTPGYRKYSDLPSCSDDESGSVYNRILIALVTVVCFGLIAGTYIAFKKITHTGRR